MINHDLKIIFFHVPKAAGLSVGQFLGTYKPGQHTDHRTIYELLPLRYGMYYFLKSADLYYLKRFFRNIKLNRNRLDLSSFQSYRKVVCVRNPYARVVSWYKNVIRDESHSNAHTNLESGFRDFVLNNLKSSWALRSQLDWVATPDNQFKADFIIKFENLEEEIPSLANSLGLDNSTLPELHRTSEYEWQEYYTGEYEVIDLIRSFYRNEFEYLGYSMDI